MSYVLTHGRSSAFATIAGVIAGDFVAVMFTLGGLGTRLMASTTLFAAMTLGGTFMALAFASVSLYALLASRMHALARDPRVSKLVNRVGGTALIGAGALTAAMRRA